MQTEVAKQIESWFQAHDGDGEFARLPRSVPCLLVPPQGPSGSIIYTTRPNLVLNALIRADHTAMPGLAGRYGLPATTDASWLRDLAGSRKFLFLGDLDPVDLMVFLWLRGRLPSLNLKYMGISDAFLRGLKLAPVEPPSISLASSERSAMPLLNRLLENLAAVVGAGCAEILAAGRKIELEAVAGAIRGSPGLLHL